MHATQSTGLQLPGFATFALPFDKTYTKFLHASMQVPQPVHFSSSMFLPTMSVTSPCKWSLRQIIGLYIVDDTTIRLQLCFFICLSRLNPKRVSLKKIPGIKKR